MRLDGRRALDGRPLGSIAHEKPTGVRLTLAGRSSSDLQTLLTADAANVCDEGLIRVQTVAPAGFGACSGGAEAVQILRIWHDMEFPTAQAVPGQFLGETLSEDDNGVRAPVGPVLDGSQGADQDGLPDDSHGGAGVDGKVGNFGDPGATPNPSDESRDRCDGGLSADVEIDVRSRKQQGRQTGDQGKRPVVEQARNERSGMRRNVGRHADDAHSAERLAQEAGLPMLGKDAPGWVVRSGRDHMHVVAAGARCRQRAAVWGAMPATSGG